MYETTQELLTLLQEEVNDTTPSNTTQARYLNLLDRAHKAIAGGGGELNVDSADRPIMRPFIFPWALAKDPIVFTLEPKEEGTATLTKRSPNVTIDIDSASLDLTDRHIKFNNQSEVYRIISHSGTSIVLDNEYLRESGSGSFEAIKLRYTVGTDLRMPIDYLRLQSSTGQSYRVDIVSGQEVLTQYPIARVYEQIPCLAGVIKQAEGSITFQFNSYPRELERVELYYIPQFADLALTGSDPIIPSAHRTILVHLAAFYHLRRRDDDRALSHLKSAKELFQSLKTEASQVVYGNDKMYGVVAPLDNGYGYEFDIEDYV